MRAPRFSNRAPYGKIEQTFANGLDGEPMITYVEADLFTSLAQTLVNTVNTAGVMGKGIAKRFKTVYHDKFRRVQANLRSRRVDDQSSVALSHPYRSASVALW